MESIVRKSLDLAIARVAKNEYHRLSSGKDPEERLNCVTQALESLGRLQHGEMPAYNNEWVSLFYVTWYQPRQINLALAIVRHFFRGNSLYVIDVGCGALAVRFAVAIAISERGMQGATINVRVDGIDPSEPMRKIGDTLWKEFQSIVSKYPRLSSLSDICDGIDSNDSYSGSTDAHIRGACSSVECWLTTVHAAYESNKCSIRDTLTHIRRKSAPELEVVTSDRKKWGVACCVAGEGFKKMPMPQLWCGPLRNTTAWRNGLINQLPQQSPGNIIPDYLGRSVQWNPQWRSPSNPVVILIRKGG